VAGPAPPPGRAGRSKKVFCLHRSHLIGSSDILHSMNGRHLALFIAIFCWPAATSFAVRLAGASVIRPSVFLPASVSSRSGDLSLWASQIHGRHQGGCLLSGRRAQPFTFRFNLMAASVRSSSRLRRSAADGSNHRRPDDFSADEMRRINGTSLTLIVMRTPTGASKLPPSTG